MHGRGPVLHGASWAGGGPTSAGVDINVGGLDPAGGATKL